MPVNAPIQDSGPVGWLIFGLFFLGLAVGGILTGETLARFGHVIYRAKEPKEFWEDIVACFLCGILLIWSPVEPAFHASIRTTPWPCQTSDETIR